MQAENLVGKELDTIIIQERLRGRGLSVLYRGFTPQHNQNVMLRVIRLNPDDSAINEKFRYEAERLRMLKHPHILPLRASGISDGFGYLTFDYFRHTALEDLIADQNIPDFTDTTRILTAIAQGLGYAHARGLVHYDLHPSTILLDASGHPFLMSFGLAGRLLGDDVMSSREGFLRPPSYTAPEHLRGGEIDIRANIYSLGAMFYHMATGRPPHRTEGDVMTVIERHIHETPIPPRRINRNLPESLQTIILKALDKTPANRHQSAESFIREVDRAMRNLYEGLDIPEIRTADLEAITIEDNPRRKQAETEARIPRWGWLVVAGTALFVVLALAYLGTTNPLPNTETPPAPTAPAGDADGG